MAAGGAVCLPRQSAQRFQSLPRSKQHLQQFVAEIRHRREISMSNIPDDPIIVSMMRTGYPPWFDDDEPDYDEPFAVYDPE